MSILSEIKISNTLLNTKITLDQDQYVFTSKYSIDITPKKAVFKINTTSDNEKHTETINLDWEEFIEPMLNRAIKSKTELKDLETFKTHVLTYIANKYNKSLFDVFNERALDIIKRAKESGQEDNREIRVDLTEAAKNIINYCNLLNPYVEEEELKATINA